MREQGRKTLRTFMTIEFPSLKATKIIAQGKRSATLGIEYQYFPTLKASNKLS